MRKLPPASTKQESGILLHEAIGHGLEGDFNRKGSSAFAGGQVDITCGKEGQSVPVGVGQPTLRIDGLTVGGTG